MKTYATLTDADRKRLIDIYLRAREMGASSPLHAAAIAAHDGFNLSDAAWNGNTGSNAYAMALAVLVHGGVIHLAGA